MAKKSGSERHRGRVQRIPPPRIEIDFLILGDYAQAVNGKLTVVGGGWTIYNPAQYPSLVPFGLGIGILVPWTETNRKHHFTFVIRGTERQELARGDGDFEVGRQPGIPAGMTQRVTLGIAGQMQIQNPGNYEITVTCSTEQKRVSFEALPVPQIR